MGAFGSRLLGYEELKREVEPEPTFPRFMELPTEIRFMIYDMIPGPRIIEVSGDALSRNDSPRIINKPPVTLHLCRESRFEALRRFKHLTFDPWHRKTVDEETSEAPEDEGEHSSAQDGTGTSERATNSPRASSEDKGASHAPIDFWIDCARDTLYFGYDTRFTLWPSILESSTYLQQHLRYLAWTCSNWPKDHPTDIALRQLVALEEMTYVCDWAQPKQRDSSQITFGAPFRKKNVPGSVYLYREDQLLAEFKAAKEAYPEWKMPRVQAGVLLRNGAPSSECDRWWCFCHGEKLPVWSN